MGTSETLDVDFDYYISHYFEMPDCVYFFLLALGVLFILFVILYIYTLIGATRYHGIKKHEYIRIEWHILVERYYEMVFSGTSILFFMDIYYLIDRFVTIEPYRSFWEKYDDFLLLLLILMSCMFNSFLDRVFVRLKFVTRDEKSAGRLTGMVYMILIFAYIKFIYQDNNYDKLITYFITLMVGRFAYFDSTIHDFVKAMQGVFKNIGLLIFLLVYTSIMSFFGFSTNYLITHNGVITNIFITHLFMCASIFVLYHIHIAELVTGRGDRTPKLNNGSNRNFDEEYGDMYENEYYEEDGEYEYDDANYGRSHYGYDEEVEYVEDKFDYKSQEAYYEDEDDVDDEGNYTGREYEGSEYEGDDDFEFVDITK